MQALIDFSKENKDDLTTPELNNQNGREADGAARRNTIRILMGRVWFDDQGEVIGVLFSTPRGDLFESKDGAHSGFISIDNENYHETENRGLSVYNPPAAQNPKEAVGIHVKITAMPKNVKKIRKAPMHFTSSNYRISNDRSLIVDYNSERAA